MNEEQQKELARSLQGAVNVSGNITPTTRQEIPQVDASLWENMSTGELVDQRIAIQQRIYMMQTSGNGNIVAQLQRGLQNLDAILAYKASKQEDVLL